jgi:hypothetical protein
MLAGDQKAGQHEERGSEEQNRRRSGEREQYHPCRKQSDGTEYADPDGRSHTEIVARGSQRTRTLFWERSPKKV